jgi:uncharacterized membrane protein
VPVIRFHRDVAAPEQAAPEQAAPEQAAGRLVVFKPARVEAFSDGVLAVAITLLVLDLHVNTSGDLPGQLVREWPSFAAYVVSFFVIGVIWVNHHALFSLAARVDRVVLFYNLLLLMWVAAIPFTTATLAGYLHGDAADARWAVGLYGLSTEGMAISFALILHRLVFHDLLRHPMDRRTGRIAVLRFGVGAVLYPVVIGIGMWSPVAMLVGYLATTVYYVIRPTAGLPVD